MKAYLLFLYAITLYITLNAWYKQGNSGIPDPAVVGPSTYLFALLLLTSNFVGGISAILGTSMTFLIYQRAHGTANTTQQPKPTGASPKAPQLKLGAK
jgi:hypothetical protein